jgi:hypothetical protein
LTSNFYGDFCKMPMDGHFSGAAAWMPLAAADIFKQKIEG